MTIEQLKVTIEQLKAHMDRRFDRLERTKADRSELRRLAARIDRCATKADLERFATKQYLKRFATKKDLKRFATKEDLKRFATKDDLKRFATKDDLQRVAARLEDRIIAMQTFLQRIASHHDRILNDHEVRIVDLEGHAQARPRSTGQNRISYTEGSSQRRNSPHLRKWRNGRRASLRS